MVAIERDLYFPVIPRPACVVRLVGGPPGGGKSTHVAQSKGPADSVIDLDQIISDLSGAGLYQADKAQWLRPALVERNARLCGLAVASPTHVAWVVVSAPGQQWAWWRQTLRPASARSFAPPLAICLERIAADPRRTHDVAAHLEAARGWFAANGQAMVRAVAQARRYDWPRSAD